jgi:uncharacterized protein DUF6166
VTRSRSRRIYEGRRLATGGALVTVRTPAGSLWPLSFQLELAKHSPTGFEWGYCGSGPAQLALALLFDALRSKERALALHQLFKSEFIAVLPHEGWTLTQEEIRAWARPKEALGA